MFKQIKYITAVVSIFFFIACNKHNSEDILNFVDPFIGTGFHGHTFPGPTLPFGMVQVGPDTRIEGWDGCSGYHYSDTIIYGFSHTHLSGTGIGDYCDLLLMPIQGNPTFNNGYQDPSILNYASSFNKKKEKARAGFYEVNLDKHDIQVQLTCTERVGIHQYSFSNSSDASIVVDLEHRDKLLESELYISSDSLIMGKRISQSWAQKQYFYFCIALSSAYDVQYNDDSIPTKAILKLRESRDDVLVKVGVSTVSAESARNNLALEAPHWNFDEYKLNAKNSWRNELQKINIKSSTDSVKTIFYTSLYHSLIAPNLISDVNGFYRGTDLKIHKDSIPNYTVFSLWDTFRATHPLYNLIFRKKTAQFLNTFQNQLRNGGQLPIWELAGNYTGCMIGYHSVSVITDAYFKGIPFSNYPELYEGMLSIANRSKLGIPAYKRFGYIPSHSESESVSKTLEYAYNDWCISKMALAFSDTLNYLDFNKRAQFYKNVFNNKTGFMQPKYNGNWSPSFSPSEVNFNYTEANSWQYSFFVPHDISGLINLHGGSALFNQKLNELFNSNSTIEGRKQADITGLIGQYAHGNEPSHHMAYLYNSSGRPEKSQFMVNKILNELYHSSPSGISGNEDCGQMSSWYVLSVIGLYDINPGDPYYIIQTPYVKESSLNLENGKVFSVKKIESGGENSIYIKKVELNGKPYNKNYIHINDVIQGGELQIYTTSDSSKKWMLDEFYSSFISNDVITINPVIIAPSKTFHDSLTISISCQDCDSILYCVDLEKKVRYKSPITLLKSTKIEAVAYKNGVSSKSEIANFIKHNQNFSISIKQRFSNQYTAGGNNALIDGLKGPNNFMTGLWQGYHNVNFEAVIDLKNLSTINSISLGALQDMKSWIWLPQLVQFWISNDGSEFKMLDELTHDIPLSKEESLTYEFKSDFKNPLKARYIKVVATNFGKCPSWHLGSGGDTWIFLDEISIN